MRVWIGWLGGEGGKVYSWCGVSKVSPFRGFWWSGVVLWGPGLIGETGLAEGSGMEGGAYMLVLEFRRSMAVLRAKRRAEQLYLTKSLLVKEMILNIWLVASMSRTSFFLIASRNHLVKVRIGWLGGEGGKVYSWCGVSEVSPFRGSWWSGVVLSGSWCGVLEVSPFRGSWWSRVVLWGSWCCPCCRQRRKTWQRCSTCSSRLLLNTRISST